MSLSYCDSAVNIKMSLPWLDLWFQICACIMIALSYTPRTWLAAVA